MNKTIFSRFFSVNITVVLLSMLIISCALFSQVGDYVVQERRMEFQFIAEQVAALTGDAMAEGGLSEKFYRKNIAMHSQANHTAILLFDAAGEVVSTAGVENLSDDMITQFGAYFTEKARQGVQTTEIGNVGGAFHGTMLAVTSPVMVEQEVRGCVVVCSAVPQIQRVRSEVMKLFCLSVLIALLIAFLLSFFLSRRIARPIAEMSRAAKSIAGGNFDKRVEIHGKDEVAQLGESFNQMTQSLADLEETRSAFISDVSHELRTPMTIISGFVEGMIDGTIPEAEHGKYLNIVLSETRRLSRLVTDLLETARIESGTRKPNMTVFDIEEMLRQAVVNYEQGITEKKIRVDMQFKYPECLVRGDEDNIYRVIINLLDNAIKFTPEEGSIKISCEPSGNKATIRIENSGDGIAPEELSHIWERFYKTDRSRSVDKRGVGLGLHLVKTIVNNHHNQIWAESEVGKYTRFSFTLDLGKKNTVL